jgi:uncharacterized protein YjbJ (UPF0337 family)
MARLLQARRLRIAIKLAFKGETEMDTNKMQDAVEDATGKVQQAVGDVLDEASTQLSGEVRDLSGKAQKLYADAASVLRDQAVESPLAALGIAALVGFLIGVAWSSAGERSYDRPARRPGPSNRTTC